MYDIMMHEMVIEFILDIATVLVVTAFSVVGAWIMAKISQKKGLENVAAATDEVVGTTQRAVEELQQTAVQSMKAASTDGKLTKSEIEQLNGMLLEKALAQMSEPAIKILNAARKDIKSIIMSAGEAAVLKMKK